MYFPKIAGSSPVKLFAPSHGDFFIDAVEILQRSEFAFSKIQFCCLRVILFINSKLQRWGSIFPGYQGRECLISIAYILQGYIYSRECLISIAYILQYPGQLCWRQKLRGAAAFWGLLLWGAHWQTNRSKPKGILPITMKYTGQTTWK